MFLYLASPYTHESELVRHKRYLDVAELTAHLLRGHIAVYSPIVHCHDIAKRYDLPKGFEFWEHYNYQMLEKAEKLLVYQMAGWNASRGLKGEIKFATARNIPITHIQFPLDLTKKII